MSSPPFSSPAPQERSLTNGLLTDGSLTPVMKQYLEIKQQYPKAILFFRMGDFYEMFGDDAKVAAPILNITLTSRDRNKEQSVPLCGIPYHAANNYISRLIKVGHTVAICEQIEDPQKAKGLVKREVTRVITPGTIIDSNMLEGKENNFLSALVIDSSGGFGLALTDISTGEFRATEYQGTDWESKLETEFCRQLPREILIPKSLVSNNSLKALWKKLPSIHLEPLEDELYKKNSAINSLREHFKVHTLAGFGLEGKDLAILATSAIISYAAKTQKCDLSHLRRLHWYNLSDFMVIDAITQQHLELICSWQKAQRSGSLLSVLDLTLTSMGGRRLKHWLLHPLLSVEEINNRLTVVEYFANHQARRQRLREGLKRVYDLERIGGKIALFSASPQDLVAMKTSLEYLPGIKEIFQEAELPPLLSSLYQDWDDLADIQHRIAETLRDQPPANIQDGGLIREGYSPLLDELRQISSTGKNWIAEMENQERQKTGISSLKIKYNKVFGYYIEVTRSNLSSVPGHYIRKQTIANGERYITAELKDYETKVLTAQEKIIELEKKLFQELVSGLAGQVARVQETAGRLANLDVLSALAEAASLYHYVKPIVNQDSAISITEGRHPVVERLSESDHFVPNDTQLDQEDNRLLIITGPNMAGKSTYIRQVAIITLMAQMGSFVPANEAVIGVVDRIFTRVGASDNLVKGQSTFMVEMSETANILNNATHKSLIILDEIGRGTSTFDGLSIAWAVAEYLHSEKIAAKTLFATHYHELTHLAESLEKAKNYNVLVREWNDEVIFLRRISAGSTDKSYGIQVARLAGLPYEVIARSKEILKSLEKQDSTVSNDLFQVKKEKGTTTKRQLSLFSSPEEHIAKELLSVDASRLSPKEALNIIKKWQKMVR